MSNKETEALKSLQRWITIIETILFVTIIIVLVFVPIIVLGIGLSDETLNSIVYAFITILCVLGLAYLSTKSKYSSLVNLAETRTTKEIISSVFTITEFSQQASYHPPVSIISAPVSIISAYKGKENYSWYAFLRVQGSYHNITFQYCGLIVYFKIGTALSRRYREHLRVHFKGSWFVFCFKNEFAETVVINTTGHNMVELVEMFIPREDAEEISTEPMNIGFSIQGTRKGFTSEIVTEQFLSVITKAKVETQKGIMVATEGKNLHVLFNDGTKASSTAGYGRVNPGKLEDMQLVFNATKNIVDYMIAMVES